MRLASANLLGVDDGVADACELVDRDAVALDHAHAWVEQGVAAVRLGGAKVAGQLREDLGEDDVRITTESGRHYVERPRRKTQTVDLDNFCPEALSNPLSPLFVHRGLLLCTLQHDPRTAVSPAQRLTCGPVA